MKKLVLLVALALASCGGSDSTQLDQVLNSHPTFERTVCNTVNQYGYQAALKAAERDWSDQVQDPKQALDTVLAHCDD